MSEKDSVGYLGENSINPYEFAKTWIDALAGVESFVSKYSILNEYLRPFPKTDFEQNGDRNHLGSVSRPWFRKDGVNLDVQLEEINGMNLYIKWITMEDAIDFVMSCQPGAYRNPAQLLAEFIEYRFKEVTSFVIKDYYGQHIINMYEIQTVDKSEDIRF